jgi:hypothetical protein
MFAGSFWSDTHRGLDRGDRRAQIVRDTGEELIALMLQLAPHRFQFLALDGIAHRPHQHGPSTSPLTR